MIEIRGNTGERGQKEICGKPGPKRSNGGIRMNEGWIKEDIWATEPTVETVERLIGWFSRERNG